MKKLIDIPLIECFSPPPGFKLVSLAATTYTIDPLVMAAIIAAASFAQDEVQVEAEITDSLTKEQLRSLILDNLSKSVFVCDHHGTVGSGEIDSTLALLISRALVKFRGRATNAGGSLHSKFVLAIYSNDTHHIGRLYVGSKNLVKADFVEFGSVMELVPTNEKDPRITRLTEFLRGLKESEIQPERPDYHRPLDMLLKVLPKLSFKGNMKDFLFQERGKSMSLMSQITEHLPQTGCSSIRVFSPWARTQVTQAFLAMLSPRGTMFVKCMDEPGHSRPESNQLTYQLTRSTNEGMVVPRQSHEKIYVFGSSKGDLLAYGSANFTGDAWGIGSRSKNTEILILESASALHLDYTETSRGESKLAQKGEMIRNELDVVRDYLDSISMEVEYAAGALRYRIVALGKPPKKRIKISIRHLMIESQDEGGPRFLQVCEDVVELDKVQIKWDSKKLYLFSNFVRISAWAGESEMISHLSVALDHQFFEGRANLRCLSYTPTEFLDSIARLMEIPFKTEERKHPEGSDFESLSRNLKRFLDKVRLEKYLYRSIRLKHKDLRAFETTRRRIDNLLKAGKDNPGIMGNPQFIRFLTVLEQLHEKIDRA